MHTNSLLGTTLRDLVFLVQDAGCDAAAAEEQLLAAYALLIKTAARRHSTAHDAERVARDAFLGAIRNFRFSTNPSLTTYCWLAMGSALEAVAVTAVPEQLPLLMEPVAVPISAANLLMLHVIATSDKNLFTAQLAGHTSTASQFGLSA